jgi:hypothetical protein
VRDCKEETKLSISSVSDSTSAWWEEYLEKLKKTQQAANGAVQETAAADVSGASAGEILAEDGNLSVLEEKTVRGAKSPSPGGMSGGAGASIKWIEALVQEENDGKAVFSASSEEYL